MSREVRTLGLFAAVATAGAIAWSLRREPAPAPDALVVCANDALRRLGDATACVVPCAKDEACLHPTGDPADGVGARVLWNGDALWVRIDGAPAATRWHIVAGEPPPPDVLGRLTAGGHGLVSVAGTRDAAAVLDVAEAWLRRRAALAEDTVVAGRRAADVVTEALGRNGAVVTLGTGPRPGDLDRCTSLTGKPSPGVCARSPLRTCDEDAACAGDRCLFAAVPEPAAFGADCPADDDAPAPPVVSRWDVWLAAPEASTPAGRDTADGVAWGAAQAWQRLPASARGAWSVVPDATLADLWRAWADRTVSQSR